MAVLLLELFRRFFLIRSVLVEPALIFLEGADERDLLRKSGERGTEFKPSRRSVPLRQQRETSSFHQNCRNRILIFKPSRDRQFADEALVRSFEQIVRHPLKERRSLRTCR